MGINDLDLNLIKVFVSVAEERSFTKAAKKLFVEQSAVSKAIKRLELETESVLFLRTKRYVELTSKGESLLPIARDILFSSEKLLKLAQDKENEISGTLKFGAESPLSFMTMPKVIADISEIYPRLWPMMFTGVTSDVVRRVKSRELEFAFLFYEAERIKELEYVEMAQCEFKIVASTKIAPEALNSFIGSREINDEHSPKLPTFNKLKKLNKSLLIKYSSNDISAYKELILNGLGIGILPKELIKDELKKKKLKVLYPKMKFHFPIYVVYHSSYPLSLEAQRMIEVFKALV